LSENQPDNDDITQNIPGMPQHSTKSKCEDKSKQLDDVIGEKEIQHATEILKKAKEQNTLKYKDEFYSSYYTANM
jgi:hypothetical protein